MYIPKHLVTNDLQVKNLGQKRNNKQKGEYQIWKIQQQKR